ncbi:GNAT family N-acetyltransferase [Endozoicomonas sp. OPT23]|uniref:GNAT family N-acetyltransferase n=1 Tax=Endozoicomonas sp. OPT23 TaxID=2072845 RepID=UPI001E2FA6FB|nr:GNAT family N-acetyltransferase [Endozoicomonas sp. OPT23]
MKKPTENDFDLIREILSCPSQTKFLPNEEPYPEEKQREYLKNRIAHWEKHNFGTFIVSLKGSKGEKVGFAGVEFAPDPQYIDIRFAILRGFEGQGLATKASKLVIDYTFSNTNHTKIYGVAMHSNQPSKSVLKKLGMKSEPKADLYFCKGLDHFSITPSYA